VNGFNSYSGTGSLRALVAPLSRDGRFFGTVKVSGAHVRSVEMVRAGEADVAAIDCVTYTLLGRYRPSCLSGVRILAPTDPVPAPPYVTSRDYPPETVARMQHALTSVLNRTPRYAFCDDLFIEGVSLVPLEGTHRFSTGIKSPSVGTTTRCTRQALRCLRRSGAPRENECRCIDHRRIASGQPFPRRSRGDCS
jgi:hypothetical protein